MPKDAKNGAAASSADADEDILDVVDDGKETPIVDAGSSDADGEAEGNEILNVVRDVVDERETKPDAAASPPEGDGTGDAAGEKSPKVKEPDDVNYTDVPFHKHPRFQKLLKEHRASVTDAGRYQNVQKFLDDNGLPAAEAADALSVFAQAKTDPIGAWTAIKPWVQKLLIAAGEVIPEDLNARVTSGELSREAALEIGKHRATTEAMKAGQTFKEQQAEQRAQSDLGLKLVSTATDWETERKQKDPNFEAKLAPLQKEVAWLQSQEGKPSTPEGVLDQLKRAYKSVNETFRPAAPRPERRPALRPVTGGQVATNIRPEPTSTLDIIRANRRTA